MTKNKMTNLAGAGVGVGMLKGAGIPLFGNKKII